MKWTGKITGGFLGILFSSPTLFIIGLIIGHLSDIGWLQYWRDHSTLGRKYQARVQSAFFNATFLVMGHIAKSDGKISAQEIRFAEQIMQEMNLSKAMRQQAIALFNRGKAPDFNLEATLRRLRLLCAARPSLLKMFIDIQLKMAQADRPGLSDAQKRKIRYISRQLGFYHFQFSDQHRSNGTRTPHTHSLRSDYATLGVNASASDADIKKAYRKRMSQHHPDKLMSKGLPPEMIKLATEKTQAIKSAYERIVKSRQQGVR